MSEKLNNSNIIKNISYDQKEILFNVMKLYNNGEPFDCDITASTLKFYEQKKNDRYVIPEPKYLFDVYPQFDKIKKIEPFKKLPLDDGSIKSVIVDLPFVISPKTCASMKKDKEEKSCIIANRFSSWYPYLEAYENMYWWMNECNRILSDGGIICWKMQDTISASIYHSFIEFCKICAQDNGLYLIDEFFLEAKGRLISAPKMKTQQHSRRYTSSFIVIKKDSKNGVKYSPLKLLEHCKKNVFEGKTFELK